ncbi:hypothetical protein ACIA5H_14675 [Nocardia sp. NPDC051900]|uniref:hypothetical protein n=1 Tax=Nocardia sp. NPDC051900 TaxID=3364326 RepID=UPI00378EFFCF
MPVGDMAHRRRCFGQWMAPLDRRAQPINVGPAMLRYIDATVGCLRAAGFSLPQADRAWNALDGHRYGFTLQELNFPRNRADTSLRHNSSCRASQPRGIRT